MSAATKKLRALVFARACSRCECGCKRFISEETGRLDHFFGRGKVPEALSNCWALHLECDEAKTRNVPSGAHWARRFGYHAQKHGFYAESEACAARVQVLVAKGRANGGGR